MIYWIEKGDWIMTRYFNTEGRCKPDKHYMVPIGGRLKAIKEQYVDREKYFVINRGRQYGKTTTLMALAEYLRRDYIVVLLDFQGIGSEEFANAQTFTRAFTEEFYLLLTMPRWILLKKSVCSNH